jgi:hypothetical protein
MGAPLLLLSSLRQSRKSSIANTTTSNNSSPPSSSLLDKLQIDILENEENNESSIQIQLIEEVEEGGGGIITTASSSMSILGKGKVDGRVRTNSSKMSNFAKRFSNSTTSSSNSSNRQNSSSSNDTGGGGGGRDNNGDQSRDFNNGNGSNGGSGDGNNNNNDDKKNPTSSLKSNPSSPTNYSPERIQFANNCTLPQHIGPESTAPLNTPTWTPVSGTQFKVRVGPNYTKLGNKESSLPSLYEVYTVRYFRSKARTTSCMADIMPLPSPSLPSSSIPPVAAAATTPAGSCEVDYHQYHNNPYPELDGTNIPHVLIVHFTLPYESPSMFTPTDNGYGGECIYYLRPTRRFLDEVASSSSSTTAPNSSVRRTTTTPATQLFINWCNTCEHNPSMRGRFKCMALVRDIEKHNFGPLLRTYNGKPVLITDSGSVVSGMTTTDTDTDTNNGNSGSTRYIELTVNVHKWAYMAKKGFVSLLPKFAVMQLEVGFTIEAQDDAEMPECMLGSTVLSYISDTTGPVIHPEMQK